MCRRNKKRGQLVQDYEAPRRWSQVSRGRDFGKKSKSHARVGSSHSGGSIWVMIVLIGGIAVGNFRPMGLMLTESVVTGDARRSGSCRNVNHMDSSGFQTKTAATSGKAIM